MGCDWAVTSHLVVRQGPVKGAPDPTLLYSLNKPAFNETWRFAAKLQTTSPHIGLTGSRMFRDKVKSASAYPHFQEYLVHIYISLYIYIYIERYISMCLTEAAVFRTMPTTSARYLMEPRDPTASVVSEHNDKLLQNPPEGVEHINGSCDHDSTAIISFWYLHWGWTCTHTHTHTRTRAHTHTHTHAHTHAHTHTITLRFRNVDPTRCESY